MVAARTLATLSLLVMVSALAPHARGTGPSDGESPFWSPEIGEGSWWRIRLTHNHTGQSWEGVLVAGYVDGRPAIGFHGGDDMLSAALGFHVVPVGVVGPHLEFAVNEDEFQPLRLDGAHDWPTEFMGYPVQAEASVNGTGVVSVHMTFPDHAFEWADAVYEPALGFYRRLSVHRWAEMVTLDHGRAFGCAATVPWNLDLQFLEGSHYTDTPRPALGPPVLAQRSVRNAYDRSALFMLAGGATGPNRIHVVPPDGVPLAANTDTDGAVSIVHQIRGNPIGEWTIASTSRAGGIAYAELQSFDARTLAPVGSGAGPLCAPPNEASAPAIFQGRAAFPAEDAWIAATALAVFAAGAVAAILAWPRSWVPLFARIRREDILQQRRRLEILELVRARPGINTQGIRGQLELGWGTAIHHLAVLERHGLVRHVRWGRNRNWYVAGQMTAAESAQHAALLRPRAREVYDLIRASPGVLQKTLADALGLHRTTIDFHTRNLERAGLVVALRRRNLVRYYERPADGKPNAPSSTARQ